MEVEDVFEEWDRIIDIEEIGMSYGAQRQRQW